MALGVGKPDQQQVVGRPAMLFQIMLYPLQIPEGLVVEPGPALGKPEVDRQPLVIAGQAAKTLGRRVVKFRLYRNGVLGNESGLGHQGLAFLAKGEVDQPRSQRWHPVSGGVHEQAAGERVILARDGQLIGLESGSIAFGNGQHFTVAHRRKAGETDARGVPADVIRQLVVGFVAPGIPVQGVLLAQNQGFEGVPGAGTVVSCV